MKYFVAYFVVYDGEHESHETVIIKAQTRQEAELKAKALEHSTDCYGDCCDDACPDAHPFSHSDGQTASSFIRLAEDTINKQQAEWADKVLNVHIY